MTDDLDDTTVVSAATRAAMSKHAEKVLELFRESGGEYERLQAFYELPHDDSDDGTFMRLDAMTADELATKYRELHERAVIDLAHAFELKCYWLSKFGAAPKRVRDARRGSRVRRS